MKQMRVEWMQLDKHAVPMIRIEALRDLVAAWEDQKGAKESMAFRLAMRALRDAINEPAVAICDGDEA